MSADHSFSSTKIFITLFILTAVEVLWSIFFKDYGPFIKWGGLLAFALWKGILIYTYFMHMRFEGWIIKGLLAPTPLLIAVLLCAIMPDVSYNSRLDWDVGAQLDKSGHEPGHVVRNMALYDHKSHEGDEEDGEDAGGH
jgi:caa(3)-type oxidase subunit IV